MLYGTALGAGERKYRSPLVYSITQRFTGSG